jgi:hypothetical protein
VKRAPYGGAFSRVLGPAVGKVIHTDTAHGLLEELPRAGAQSGLSRPLKGVVDVRLYLAAQGSGQARRSALVLRGIAMMSTLYRDRRGLSLRLEGRALAIYADEVRQGTVPLHLLERVVMRSAVGIESSLPARLADAGIGTLIFGGRNRRPPRDPANAVLSLGYTLLHFEAVRACYGAGLDPMIGFFHNLDFGRESLACDLVEPLRPRLDAGRGSRSAIRCCGRMSFGGLRGLPARQARATAVLQRVRGAGAPREAAAAPLLHAACRVAHQYRLAGRRDVPLLA